MQSKQEISTFLEKGASPDKFMKLIAPEDNALEGRSGRKHMKTDGQTEKPDGKSGKLTGVPGKLMGVPGYLSGESGKLKGESGKQRRRPDHFEINV